MKVEIDLTSFHFVIGKLLQSFKYLVNITKILEFLCRKQKFVISNYTYQLVDLIETLVKNQHFN